MKPVALGLLFTLLMLATVGCKGKPIRVQAGGRITADMPATQVYGPVAPMVVDGTACETDWPRVAVIDVDGVLLNMDMTGFYSMGENPVGLFRERLDAAAADPRVRAVVVRINSPGGGVTACDIMWRDLNNFKARTGLPVVACLMDVGAGGAYYLATATDQIMAHPTTITGGIGVILNLYNLQDAMAQFNVLGLPVKSGDNFDLGTPIKAQQEESRAILQTMADEFHGRFKNLVTNARPKVDARQPDLYDGRVFTANQALQRGLIDEIGYVDDAVRLAREMAGTPCAQVVFYHRCNDRARSPYAITPNVPIQTAILPLSIPGLERSRLPTFLYLWQPDPTLERWGGR